MLLSIQKCVALLNVRCTHFDNSFPSFPPRRKDSRSTSSRATQVPCHGRFVRDYWYHAFTKYVETPNRHKQLTRQRHKSSDRSWPSTWLESRGTPNRKEQEIRWPPCGLSRHQDSTASDDSFNLSWASWIRQSRQYWCSRWSNCKARGDNVVLWGAASPAQNI